MMKDNKMNANQVNEKTLQLLMQVAVNDEPVSAKTLSEQLAVPLSSLYRHLKLLKEWNLIEESAHEKTFIVGPSMQALRCSYVQGQSQPLLRGASSKVMLAFMPPERCERILRYFGQEARLNQWQTELEIIRKNGYAVSTSEIDPGVSGISAPVMKGSKLIGAVSVMAPAHRVEADKQRIILHVLQAARALPPER